MDDVLYYLDWCPIQVLPVTNELVESLCYRRSIPADHPPDIELIFERQPALLLIDYSIRSDGIFIFRLVFEKGPFVRWQAACDLSNHIKRKLGHRHEFHSYPYYERMGKRPITSFALQTFRFFKHAWDKIVFNAGPIHKTLDHRLVIEPVEIEDPFSKLFLLEIKKTFLSLEDVIRPARMDNNLGQLRCKKYDVRACLELRQRYADVKNNCIEVLDTNKNRWSNSINLVSILYGFASSAVAFISFYYMLSITDHQNNVAIETPLAFALIVGFAVFIVMDNRRQVPKLEIIQRVIGFYTYGNIFLPNRKKYHR